MKDGTVHIEIEVESGCYDGCLDKQSSITIFFSRNLVH